MTKEKFTKALDNITTAAEAFEQMETSGDSTIQKYCKLFGLPCEPHSYSFCQKMRARLMNAVSYHEGVKHLDGKKFPVLSKIELEDARKKANQLLTFDTEQYKKAVLFLNNNYQ